METATSPRSFGVAPGRLLAAQRVVPNGIPPGLMTFLPESYARGGGKHDIARFGLVEQPDRRNPAEEFLPRGFAQR